MARNRLFLGKQLALALSLFSPNDSKGLSINSTKVGVCGVGLLASSTIIV